MYWNQQEGNYTSPPDTCSPVQINLLVRHGARFPGEKDINKLDALSEVMHANAAYYNDAYKWMATWKNPYSPKESDLLTYSGQLQLYNLAQRMIKEYPKVMTQQYQPYVYDMQCTQKSRTCISGSSFAYSMLQEAGHLAPLKGSFRPSYMYTESIPLDLKLRFFDNCPLYVNSVDSNSSAINQYNIYRENQVQQAADEVSKKIGVYPHWNISYADLTLMFKSCGYDIAVNNNRRHFCTLFDENTTRIMEYATDLDTYYTTGYGYPINYEMACLLLKEMFSIHEAYANGSNTDLLAKFRFAHAETVMPLVALFGLFKDQSPLLANWTDEQINSRQWRGSQIAPFASNVQTVLYKCSDSYRVKLLVNEKEYSFPGCSDLYCDLKDLLDIYSNALECPFLDMCYPGTSPCGEYCHSQTMMDSVNVLL